MRRSGTGFGRLALLAACVAVAEGFRAPLSSGFQSGAWGVQQTGKRTCASIRMGPAGTEAPPKSVADVKQAVMERLKADPSLTLPAQFQQALSDILEGATVAAEQAKKEPQRYKELLSLLLQEAADNSRNLYPFGPFHKAIRDPPDFTRFGEEFFDMLFGMPTSGVLGKEQLVKIIDYVRQGHNVVLLANHQTEPDPYILRRAFKQLVPDTDPILDKLVFVAGAKVRTDLFTIPFSKGLNLICIHSKKYIEDDPSTKAAKTQENLMAMKALTGLFVEGGHVIWVAPSGGRDRVSKETGKMAVAPFDSRACDMFRVVSMKSDKPTHFFPLSMLTGQVLPPPEKVAMEIGERRLVARKPVHIYFGEELTKERVTSQYLKRKAGESPSDDTREELEKKALKEGFSFVAEDDVKKHYDVLLALDSVLEEPEITVQYK